MVRAGDFEVHLWDEEDVAGWLRRIGLRECVASFRSASIDGAKLLELTPSSIGEELQIEDEQLLLVICAHIQPLKAKWRRARELRGLKTDLGDLSHCDVIGDLVVVLSTSALPEGAGGVFARLDLDGKRKKSAALIPSLPHAPKEAASQKLSIPVSGDLMQATLQVEGFAWLPRAGERSLGRPLRLDVSKVREHGSVESAELGPLRIEVSWVPAPSWEYSSRSPSRFLSPPESQSPAWSPTWRTKMWAPTSQGWWAASPQRPWDSVRALNQDFTRMQTWTSAQSPQHQAFSPHSSAAWDPYAWSPQAGSRFAGSAYQSLAYQSLHSPLDMMSPMERWAHTYVALQEQYDLETNVLLWSLPR